MIQGLAVSSDAGRQDRCAYSGRLELGADCLGRMTQRDAEGTAYAYRVVVFANGGGYGYLQTPPATLPLGCCSISAEGEGPRGEAPLRRIMGRPVPEGP